MSDAVIQFAFTIRLGKTWNTCICKISVDIYQLAACSLTSSPPHCWKPLIHSSDVSVDATLWIKKMSFCIVNFCGMIAPHVVFTDTCHGITWWDVTCSLIGSGESVCWRCLPAACLQRASGKKKKRKKGRLAHLAWMRRTKPALPPVGCVSLRAWCSQWEVAARDLFCFQNPLPLVCPQHLQDGEQMERTGIHLRLWPPQDRLVSWVLETVGDLGAQKPQAPPGYKLSLFPFYINRVPWSLFRAGQTSADIL